MRPTMGANASPINMPLKLPLQRNQTADLSNGLTFAIL